MNGSAPLEKLDTYLRAIWLECCGHLSKFTIGGWGGRDIAKSRKADWIFGPSLVLRHLYDFGTTSETDIKVVGPREGKATTKLPIALLARNIMPETVCQECGELARWLCSNASTKKVSPATYARRTLKTIHTTITEIRCRYSTHRVWECAAMMVPPSHRIDWLCLANAALRIKAPDVERYST